MNNKIRLREDRETIKQLLPAAVGVVIEKNIIGRSAAAEGRINRSGHNKSP